MGAIRFGDHAVERVVGNRSAARDGRETRTTTALQPMNGIKMGDTTNFPNCLAVGYTFNF